MVSQNGLSSRVEGIVVKEGGRERQIQSRVSIWLMNYEYNMSIRDALWHRLMMSIGQNYGPKRAVLQWKKSVFP